MHKIKVLFTAPFFLYPQSYIEAPRRKRRGTILTSVASNLRSFFLLFLCSLAPQCSVAIAMA